MSFLGMIRQRRHVQSSDHRYRIRKSCLSHSTSKWCSVAINDRSGLKSYPIRCRVLYRLYATTNKLSEKCMIDIRSTKKHGASIVQDVLIILLNSNKQTNQTFRITCNLLQKNQQLVTKYIRIIIAVRIQLVQMKNPYLNLLKDKISVAY